MIEHHPHAADTLRKLTDNPGLFLRELDRAGLVVVDAMSLSVDREELDTARHALTDALEGDLRLARYVVASDAFTTLRERYGASREAEWLAQIEAAKDANKGRAA